MAERSQASSNQNLPAPREGPDGAPASDSPGTPHPAQDKTDLQVFLQYTLPKFLAKNVDRLLLLLVVLAAGWWAWNYRANSIRQATADVQAAASNAFDTLQLAKSRGVLLAPSSAESDVKGRLDTAAAIDAGVEAVLGSTYATPELKAKVLSIRGELNYTLSQLPESAWPSSGPTARSGATFLEAAEKAYKQILTDHANQPAFAVPALLAVASIQESRQNWTEATKYYDLVINDANARPVHKQLAQTRKAILPQLKVPIAPIHSATTQPVGASFTPAIQPMNIEPTTTPATTPAR